MVKFSASNLKKLAVDCHTIVEGEKCSWVWVWIEGKCILFVLKMRMETLKTL